ncbi:MAG: GYF domain-containing protein [Hyphomonas sp.]|nr:GYF domain-containing protein [Hyphomonas sp.]
MRTRPRIERVLPAKAARAASDGALNLADLDPPVWHVMRQNTAHGPFTLGQLQAFADAGKIGPLTRISSGNGEPFLPALDHAQLRGRIEAFLANRATRRAEASNFVIVSGPGTPHRHALGAALNTLGRFAEPIPGTFVLRTTRSLSEVRRALAAAAPDGTPLMIFESRDARLGWTGLSAEGAESLRAVWDAPISPSTD